MKTRHCRIERTMTLTIRPAIEADLPQLVVLLRQSWLATFAADLPFEAVQTFAKADPARQYAEAMWTDFSVADLEGAVIGMCHVVGELVAAIHVKPAFKRQGVGAALMNSAETAIFAAHPRARLEVLAFNAPAQAFYRGRGWAEVRRYATQECGAPIEAIEMVKAR
jgi:ribosomal protein S18 acetylase RimI-like enzyme